MYVYQKPEKWGVFVFPSDNEEGLPLFHQVTIRNSPPEITDVQSEILIEPIEDVSMEQESIEVEQICIELTVESFDNDGDSLSYSTTWRRGNDIIYIGELQKVCVLEGGFDLVVDVLVYDGEDSSDIFQYQLEIPEQNEYINEGTGGN